MFDRARRRLGFVLLLASAAACRRAPDVVLPEWQPEIAIKPAQWLKNPDIRLLQEYVRIPTVDPPGNERPGADLLRSWLACEGIPSELICPEKDRCNLYASIKGRDSRHALLLLNHIDVVPVYRPGWKHDPFGGEIETSYLYGRGSYDMKSIGVAQIVAFADLAKSGIVPDRDVVFLAECGEEYLFRDGAAWLFEHRPDVLAGVDCVLNEGGWTEIVAGFPRYRGIEIAQGGQAYALLSSDRKEDLAFPQKFRSLGLFVRPEPAVQQYLDAVADFRAPYFANAFRHPDLLRDPDVRKWIPYQNLSLVTGGILTPGPFPAEHLPGFDSPGKWDAALMISMPVGMDAGPELRRLLGTMPPGVKIVSSDVSPVTGASRFDAPEVRAIERVLEAAEPGIPVIPIVNAFSETTSTLFRARGIRAYGFTPFQIDPLDAAARHGSEERIFLPFFTRGVKIMREALFEMVGASR